MESGPWTAAIIVLWPKRVAESCGVSWGSVATRGPHWTLAIFSGGRSVSLGRLQAFGKDLLVLFADADIIALLQLVLGLSVRCISRSG